MQNSHALKRQAEQNYKDLINAKLNETHQRIQEGSDKTFVVQEGYFASILDRVKEQKAKAS